MTRTEYATATIPFYLYGSEIVVYTFNYDPAAQETVARIKKDLTLINSETVMHGCYINQRPAFAREVLELEAQGVKSVDDVNRLSLEVDLLSEEFFAQKPEHYREYINRAEKVYRSLAALLELFCHNKKNSEG
jgi:hypothetical protein